MGTTEVVAEQKKASTKDYIRCYLTKEGETTYTYTTADTPNRILSVYQRQDPYKEVVDVVLSNQGQTLSDIDFRGYKLTLGFGFVIAGSPDYIDQPPLWVIDQEYDSRPAYPGLSLTLHCKGMMSRIADDHANSEFTAGDADAMSDLITDILDASLVPYNHCEAYTLDWSGVTLATDVNLFLPAENFQIFLNSNRLAMLRLLLDHTYVFMRPASDEKIYFIKPVTTGTSYDYEYELGGDHTFFLKLDSRRVVLPNYIVVYGGDYDENTDTWEFDGYASDAAAIDLYKEVRYYEAFNGIVSDAECTAVADAVLSNFALNRRMCTAIVPMNCTAKLFDYVKITDSRQGDSATGNIGYIVRRFESGKFQMEIGFGGWLNDRRIADFVSAYRKPVKDSAVTWLTESCPETYLLPGDSITFHTIPLNVGGADRLYVKAYGVYASGYADVLVKIKQNAVSLWEKEADIYRKLWTYDFVGLTDDGDFVFMIENDNSETEDGCYVSAFIVYGLTSTTPG